MPFAGKFRELIFLMAGLIFLAGLALVGLSFLLSSAAEALAPQFGRPGANALVGLAALLPLAVIYLVQALKAHAKKEKEEKEESEALLSSDGLPDTVREWVDFTQRLVKSAPFAAILVALIGGLALTRMPLAALLALLPVLQEQFHRRPPA
ncbi:MAG: hypothetical protein AB7O04_04810 [Hyphomonadaceae bacterium]